DGQGGTDTVWRIYEGHTTPLLRGFLTPVTVTANDATATYDGTLQTGAAGYTIDPHDADLLSGSDSITGGGRDAGTHTLGLDGLWSTQQGYDLIIDEGTLTIEQAQATVIANSANVTYNGQQQNVSGFTASGLVNGEDVSVLTGVTTSGGSGTNAGSYLLTASGSDGNYALTFVDGALTIDKATATVTANSGTTTYTGTEQNIDGFTVEGLINGEGQQVLDVQLSGGRGTNAGNYDHTASGDAQNYLLTFVDGELTIDKASATVTANSGTTTYTGTEQSVDGFTVEGLVNGEGQEVLDVQLSGGRGTNAGNYDHTASGDAQNYLLTFIDGELTIDKAQATVTANSGTTTYTGTEQSVDGFTVAGLVNGEGQEVLDVQLSGGRGTHAGHYAHTASGDAQNYLLTFIDGELTIDKATATVTANSGTTTYTGIEQSVDGFTVAGLVNGEGQEVL
ncbi:MBG domain-containing protein, partial [Vreelandella olivaria]|uniref:MBG domain-containing protein n=1 Tax=Vreelandella olivaria TaxID=390919 RepID=UPI00201F0FDC